MIDPRLEQLFAHLQRGGSRAYYWTTPDKRSSWHQVGHNGILPKGTNIYFGVHPTHAKRNANQRARAIDVCAVNCLFAEFDAKDFGNLKESTLTHIHALPLPPSVVVDSGGGYHCYWLLHEPFAIAGNADCARINRIQKAWVAFVDDDDGAKDLARVLRVPGTKNAKYTPPRLVTFVSANFAELYELDELEAISYAPPAPEPPTGTPLDAQHDPQQGRIRIGATGRRRRARPRHCRKRIAPRSADRRPATARGTAHSPERTGRWRYPRQVPTEHSSAKAATGSPADLDRAPENPQARAEKRKSPPPTDDELASEWRQQHLHTAYGLGDFRRYDHGVWVLMPEETIEAELLEVITAAKGRGVRPSARLLASVKKLASVIVSVRGDRWNANPDVIVCHNGTLHIPTMMLREHQAEDY